MANFYFRKANTDQNGFGWSEAMKQAVWRKGTVIPGYNSDIYRRDMCGYIMVYGEYGNRESPYGWEIDHIIPVSHGGRDNIENLQPLQWYTNASKSDKINWSCSMR